MTAKKSAAKKSTAKPVEVTCNVPDCPREPTTRGLCNPHYDTHRGLANPKE